MKFIEEVIPFEILAGSNSVVEVQSTTPDGSTVVGCVIYSNLPKDDISNSSVNASIFADQGEISALQDIKNYRSREASYDRGYKPLPNFISGKKVRLEIRIENNSYEFDIKGQLILIKIPQNC